MRIKKTLKTILCLLLCLSMTVPAVELNVKAETTELLTNGTFTEDEGWEYAGTDTANKVIEAPSWKTDDGLLINALSPETGKSNLLYLPTKFLHTYI